jgi:hypothetical protein
MKTLKILHSMGYHYINIGHVNAIKRKDAYASITEQLTDAKFPKLHQRFSSELVELIWKLLCSPETEGNPKTVLNTLKNIYDIHDVSYGDIKNIKNKHTYKDITDKFEPFEFKNLNRKISEEDVHHICKLLIENNMKTSIVLNILKDEGYDQIKYYDVNKIRNKAVWKDITSLYF